jgi:hypothetical protein
MKWCNSFLDSFRGSRGSSMLSVRKDMKMRAQGTGISFLGGSDGELGRELVCRDLCELWRRSSLSVGAPYDPWGGVRSPGTLMTDLWKRAQRASLSMGALWREPGGGLPYWRPWRLCRIRLCWRASFHRASVVETGRGFGYPGLRKKGLDRCPSLRRAPLGTWGGGPSVENVENSWKVLAMENLSLWELC